jgi:hypothetical protein
VLPGVKNDAWRGTFLLRTNALHITLPALFAVLLLASLGCERETTLIDPPDFFAFAPENAWPAQCAAPARKLGVNPVPPPPGLDIQACPNPAPPGTEAITIQFRLETTARNVNLAIVSHDGEVVAELLQGASAAAEQQITVRWLLDGVPPGDYRAYFLAGAIETSGDLRVD